jgi:(3S)-malyl-CoA thioesterase
MDTASRLYRSVLYIPASKERALEKARELPCDAIIFDLEDAVAPDAKAAGRAALVAALGQGGYGHRVRIVRINALTTEWGLEDVRALKDVGADAILLPKVNAASDIDTLAELLGDDVSIWAMMETPASIFGAQQIAAHGRVTGLVAGTNDLAKDLGVRARVDRLPLMMALQTIVMAARAARIPAIDGVFNRFKDEEGLAAECAQGRDLGFDGKTLIHPAQVGGANVAFAPTEAEIALARRQIAAHEASEASGEGVAVVDGAIVENLHVATARRILAKAQTLAEMETI